MSNWKKRTAITIAGTLTAGALMFTGASTAQAYTLSANISVGSFSTKSSCESTMRSYISSWTKISQSCTYYPKQGGFTDNGWYFHYRAIRA